MGVLTAGERDRAAGLPAADGVAGRAVRLAGGVADDLLAALAVVPLVLIFVRNYPADLGVLPYGATTQRLPAPRRCRCGPAAAHLAAGDDFELADRGQPRPGAVRRTLQTLREAARTRTFWALAGGFAICGATTNGLIGTHFVPAAHDHGMPTTTAAGLLARGRHLRHRRHDRLRLRSPTGSTRASCWPSTTRSAASAC